MSGPWLVSRRFDLSVFLLPAFAALALAALGPSIAPDGKTSLPMWIIAILMVDVAHVWSTIYRTYLDKEELKRRPGLYSGIPIGIFVVGVILYSISALTFWRVLAYVAVWHFVRQQYGWVVLYNRRAGDEGSADKIVDSAAIYAATLFPIIWWHAFLPRNFDWFLPGDFLPNVVGQSFATFVAPIYVAILAVFAARQVQRFVKERVFRAGKVVIVVTTAACWGVGIVLTNTDWSFTVTNVLIHGIPYIAIIWHFGRAKEHKEGSILAWIFGGGHLLLFYGVLVGLAYTEELAWDRLIWHDHPALFPGAAITLGRVLEILIVPLLALPQATHYFLDAWIWKTSPTKNPGLAETMSLRTAGT